jgi:hypothetical protein
MEKEDREDESEMERCSQSNCEHRFVRDLIDIDPDRSMIIVYCELCEKLQHD